MAVDAGSIYSSVRIRLNALDGDIKGVYARLDALEAQITQKMDKPTKAVTASFKSMSLAGVASFLAINRAMKSVIGTSATFEQSMANVASVSGASATEFDKLTAAAEQAGETTRFTASQAADGLYYLSSAGFDATQSVSALNGVLTLAQATGSDLASTSASMAATISQFGLKAEESGRVSNIFAAAISSSQANMEKLTTGLRQVGPVAGTLGISLEEVTANLDALYNKGFQGEQAGTALRSILLDLVDPSSEVVKQLKAQGLEYDKVNPRVVGLTGAFNNMAAAGVDLTTAFNKVSASEALALVQTAKDSTKNLIELQNEITGTNKALEAMNTQNDTLAGDMDMLKSQTEATSIKFGKEFTPALRDASRAAKAIIGWLGKIPGPLKAIVGSAALVTAGIAGITGALSLLGITLSVTAPVLAGVGLALTSIVTAGTLISKNFADQKNITQQLNAATESLISTSDEYKKTQDELTKKANTLTAAEKEVLENRKKLLALEIEKQLQELSKQYDKTNRSIDKQAKALEKTKKDIEDVNIKTENYRKNLIRNGFALEGINEQVAEYRRIALGNLLEKEISQTGNLTTAKNKQLESVNAIAKAVADGTIIINSNSIANKTLYDRIMAQVGALQNQSKEITTVGTETEKTATKLTTWQEALKSSLNVENISTGAQAVTEYTNKITTQLNRAVSAAKTTGANVANVYESYANQVSDAIKSLLMSGEYKSTEDTIKDLVSFMNELKKEQKDAIDITSTQSAEYGKLAGQIKLLGDYVGPTFDNMKSSLIDTITEASKVGSITTDQYTKLINLIDSATQKTYDWNNALQTMASGTLTSLVSALDTASQAVVQGESGWSAYAKAALNGIAAVIEGIAKQLVVQAAALIAADFWNPAVWAGQAWVLGEAGSAFIAAGAVKGLAANMATGGIIEPTQNGVITRQAENGYGEVDYNVGPTGQAHTQQMGAAIAQELVKLGAMSGSNNQQPIKLYIDGAQVTRVITRRQENGDY
jgi:TP901 family phage tail tape measure protein